MNWVIPSLGHRRGGPGWQRQHRPPARGVAAPLTGCRLPPRVHLSRLAPAGRHSAGYTSTRPGRSGVRGGAGRSRRPGPGGRAPGLARPAERRRPQNIGAGVAQAARPRAGCHHGHDLGRGVPSAAERGGRGRCGAHPGRTDRGLQVGVDGPADAALRPGVRPAPPAGVVVVHRQPPRTRRICVQGRPGGRSTTSPRPGHPTMSSGFTVWRIGCFAASATTPGGAGSTPT